jgi:DNA end-binding protein Ku
MLNTPSRAISGSTISFGLVSIPVEVFPATASKSVHFNLLHAKDGSRTQEKIYCVTEEKLVDRSELVHGFEIEKGQYVTFTNELKKLEAGYSREIEITEFIPISQVDPVYFASSYLLGSGAGSAKAYHLLNAAMTKTQRAALAKFVMRSKEHLVLIRPYGDVLMLHTMHYGDETRPSNAMDSGTKASVGASELKLAERLIDDLSQEKFKPDKFEDTYRQKILKMAEQKAAGQKVTVPSAPKRGKVIDLMSALRNSLKGSGKKETQQKSEHEIAPDEKAPETTGSTFRFEAFRKYEEQSSRTLLTKLPRQ